MLNGYGRMRQILGKADCTDNTARAIVAAIGTSHSRTQ